MTKSTVVITIGIVLAFVVNLAVVEAVVLGVAWVVGQIFDVAVAYGLIALIVAGIYVLLAVAKLLLVIGFGSQARKFK